MSGQQHQEEFYFIHCICFLIVSVLDSLSHHFSPSSHLCLAWRGLRSERDAPAEVPASGERNPGTHSGGGRHPGELTARHTHMHSSSPLSCRTWHRLLLCDYPAFILLSAHRFYRLSQRDFPPLRSIFRGVQPFWLEQFQGWNIYVQFLLLHERPELCIVCALKP